MISKGILSKLDPELVIQEAMYGFIMALTLVTTAQLGIFTYASRTDLILAIIGMDFVWGAIDMYIFYRVDILAYRRRLQKYVDMNRMEHRSDKKAILADEFQGTMFEFVGESDRDRILDAFIDGEFIDVNTLHRSTLHYAFNAVTAFVVTMLTVIPSVVALMAFEDYGAALLCSSCSSAIALFFTGYLLAPGITRKSRIVTGALTAGIALFFTIMAAYLGG